jgi:integrase
MLQESAPRAGFFEPAALKAVLAQLPADLRQPIRFAAETGWRFRSEVLKLEWRRVDLKSGEVRLDAGTTKSGAGRVIFMTAEMRTILEEQQRLQKKMKAAGHIEPLVFVRWSGEGKPRSIRSYAGAWRAACRRAGQPGRLIHDLRRTAARRFVRSGLQPAVAQRLTGHATPSVFQRYNIISEADLRDAAKVLDKAAGR